MITRNKNGRDYPAAVEVKDGNGATSQGATETKEAVAAVMTAFEEFKSTNDARLKEIESKGSADPLVEEKLARVEESVAAFEGMNQKLTNLANQDKAIKAAQEQIDSLETAFNRTGSGAGGGSVDVKEAEYKDGFSNYLRTDDLEAKHREVLRERKALVAGNETLGGYYVAPSQMSGDIIKDVIEMSPMRSLATVTQVGTKSLILKKRTGTFAARRVGETEARTETTGYTTGQVEIDCPEMYAESYISMQMLEDSFFNIESEIASEFAEQFGVKEGAEFVSGIGSANQAEGFLNGNGLVSQTQGEAATLTDADGLINLYHGLKTAYATRASWVMNRATLGAVRKLKDGQGQYLWTPGIAGNVPNTILGATYTEMPDMPDIGAGLKPVGFGDWRRGYRITDRILMSVLRDPFTQASNGYIKFTARKRVGGGVIQGEAIGALTISA